MQKKILIAEDDPGIQDVLRLIFEKEGYETQVIDNGQLIYNDKYTYPDIYLLDKQLSGSSGLDICNFLKKNKKTKDIPVFIISATPGLERVAKEAGANDFIEKPFTISSLLYKVSKALASSAEN